MPICLLSSDVSSKIAAGEVIERPAAVVKELVENSLDAGATEILIGVSGGGVEYVRVSDNGAGIPAEEVELAFQRFATSKVILVSDLEVLSTLGFRGEALPSIAAVAGVSLVTRSADQEFGTRLDVVDGKILQKEPHGAALGTSVTVRHLFRSFPARRKFLRSMATETSRIQALVTRYALAYPGVRFQLSGGRTKSLVTSGSGDIRDVISTIYGHTIAQSVLEISQPLGTGGGSPLVVSGMIGPPSISRASRSHINLFVNRRWVQNRMLVYALEQAYHGFLMERRYPLAVVNIDLSFGEVDVNVHPAKTEVRFRNENQVFTSLQQAVRHTLTTYSPVPEMRRFRGPHSGVGSSPVAAAFWSVEPFASTVTSSAGHPRSSPSQAPPHPIRLEPPMLAKVLPVLRVLGQVQNTYIVAEGPDGMYLIDQHAAHERVVYERVKFEASARTSQVQGLLEPVTVELDLRQQELLELQEDLITHLGFLVEPFGDQTYLLRGVPRLLAECDLGRALVDVLDTMTEGGGFESWEERAAYSMACHGSIRAGKVLSPQEMSELARQLEECSQPDTCPHGRPTVIHLSSSQLDREFGRA